MLVEPTEYTRMKLLGPFCRCEFKVNIWFADRLVLWQCKDDTYVELFMRYILVAGLVSLLCIFSFSRIHDNDDNSGAYCYWVVIVVAAAGYWLCSSSPFVRYVFCILCVFIVMSLHMLSFIVNAVLPHS